MFCRMDGNYKGNFVTKSRPPGSGVEVEEPFRGQRHPRQRGEATVSEYVDFLSMLVGSVYLPLNLCP